MFAHHGETLADVAARVLADDPSRVQSLMSWNLHLALRRNVVGQPDDPAGALLGTDIVYTEPPLA